MVADVERPDPDADEVIFQNFNSDFRSSSDRKPQSIFMGGNAMTRKLFRTLTISVALLIAVTLQQTALAGPPLICHTIEIGNAKSLPWAGNEWRDVKRDYDL